MIEAILYGSAMFVGTVLVLSPLVYLLWRQCKELEQAIEDRNNRDREVLPDGAALGADNESLPKDAG